MGGAYGAAAGGVYGAAAGGGVGADGGVKAEGGVGGATAGGGAGRGAGAGGAAGSGKLAFDCAYAGRDHESQVHAATRTSPPHPDHLPIKYASAQIPNHSAGSAVS